MSTETRSPTPRSTPKPDLSAIEEECEHCGQPIKWVRLLPQKTPIPIDADPVGTYDTAGRLGRLHPDKTPDGHRYSVKYLAADERWMFARTYVPHKDTCPQADQWATHARSKKKSAKYGPRPEIVQADDILPFEPEPIGGWKEIRAIRAEEEQSRRGT